MSYVQRIPGGTPAARRIYETGIAFQREQRRLAAERKAKNPPPLPLVRMTAKPMRDWLWVASDPKFHQREHIDAIVNEAARIFGVLPEEIRSKRTKKRICIARHYAVQRCVDSMQIGSTTLGKLLGGRDHTGILHSLKPAARKKVADWFAENPHRKRLLSTLSTLSEPCLSSKSLGESAT